jgi:DNA (cytosine-5)-methyltransferase 1
MGWENALQCEIDPFCQTVLRYHFPAARLYGDIRGLKGKKWQGKIDILTGGFPCQPFSQAGPRRGTADDRFLWPEMLRCIREIQPTWVVAENVRGLVTLDRGLVFDRLCLDLEESGYQVQPFLIPACGVNALHRRERLWIIAHRPRGRRRQRGANSGRTREGTKTQGERRRFADCAGDAAYAQGEQIRLARFPREDADVASAWQESWLEAATRLCRLDDGLSRELDGISIPKWRRESLKAYGNAIVPQVAYVIFRAIEAAEPSCPFSNARNRS